MARYVQLVMVNAREGQDDDLNRWLDEDHIPELVEMAGYVTCHRFELAPEEAGNPMSPRRYMHLYEFETDDLVATKARIDAQRHRLTPLPDALDQRDMFYAYYKAR